MKQDFILKFLWSKPEKGYIWENCEPCALFFNDSISIPRGPYLIERDYSQNFTAYNPFDDSTLFAKFADIDMENEDSLSAFASEYGNLVRYEELANGSEFFVYPSNSTSIQNTKGKQIHHSGIVADKADYKHYAQHGTSLSFWQKELYDLSFAVMVWELAVNEDIQPLNKIVKWIIDKKGVEITKFPKKMLHKIDLEKTSDYDHRVANHIGSIVLFDSRNIKPWASNRYFYPDTIGPAKLYVQIAINEKLQKYPLQIALTLNDQGILYKHICPTSLLSAMWYQLYLALAGEITLRRCSICGKWEDMKEHRDSWSKHKKCISYERIKKYSLNRNDRTRPNN